MHVRELIELAGLVSAHGPLLVEGQRPVANEHIERYWVASKTRLDRWARSLKGFADGVNDAASALPERPERHSAHKGPASPAAAKLPWQHVRSVMEEILVSEVLTRVWTAVLCAHDRRHGADDAGPVARSVMLGHVEARHRALTLVVQAEKGTGDSCAQRLQGPSGNRRPSSFPLETAVKLNSLRRRAERWTDVLVGHLAAVETGTSDSVREKQGWRKESAEPSPPGAHSPLPTPRSPFTSVLEFAANPARARDFAEELRCRVDVPPPPAGLAAVDGLAARRVPTRPGRAQPERRLERQHRREHRRLFSRGIIHRHRTIPQRVDDAPDQHGRRRAGHDRPVARAPQAAGQGDRSLFHRNGRRWRSSQ